jgi:hypothetical protein
VIDGILFSTLIGDDKKSVSRPDKQSEDERIWSLLLEAGFFDIPPDEFADRIKEAKRAVMARLSQLLEMTTDIRERESAAYSLATLKKLETIVGRSGDRRSSE